VRGRAGSDGTGAAAHVVGDALRDALVRFSLDAEASG